MACSRRDELQLILGSTESPQVREPLQNLSKRGGSTCKILGDVMQKLDICTSGKSGDGCPNVHGPCVLPFRTLNGPHQRSYLGRWGTGPWWLQESITASSKTLATTREVPESQKLRPRPQPPKSEPLLLKPFLQERCCCPRSAMTHRRLQVAIPVALPIHYH